jgi:phosphoribulokinase
MTLQRPIMVAVGGDSGSGKTTLVGGLARIFGAERITTISLDDYHLLDRAARKEAGVTALNPAANDFALMAEHVHRLRQGESITKPTYDHGSGRFGRDEVVEPREIVVVRGLFPLFSEDLRSAFDVRIWLDPQEELKWSWKVRRDCAQRGYSVPEVIRQIVERRDDQLSFIAPQLAHADLVVRFYPPPGYFRPGTGVEHDDAHLNVRIHLERRLPPLDLDDVLGADGGASGRTIRLLDVDSPFAGTHGSAVALEIDGTVSPARAKELDERIWAHIGAHPYVRPDDIGGFLDGETLRHSDPLGLTQLLIAYQVVRAERGLDVDAPSVANGGRPARRVAARSTERVAS